MKMTVELFDSIINTSQDCVFWKDKNRRFLGVNQAFLDYYGFESADVLIGKTDEDMGWHSNPEPYKQDELRVLDGKSTYKVPGKCIIRGEERDIIASKRPLYDGDEVVGLVGSFIDVTDVVRTRAEDAHIVYNIARLRKFEFFDKLVDEISLDEILDPLTGILSRVYAVKFIQSLIEEGTPFTFYMIDLDNFKFINDNFGHGVGDQVLISVAEKLADLCDGFGLAGRFGGDEFFLIDLKNISKRAKNSFFEKLYSGDSAFRVNADFETGSAYITGTSGAASYPADAINFDDIFELTDKMLYLGKSRGRNCYSVYDSEKHKDIEISKLANHSVYFSMNRIRQILEETDGVRERIRNLMPFLTETLQISDLYFVEAADGKMTAAIDRRFNAQADDISNLMDEDIFSDSMLEQIEEKAPVFYKTLKSKNFESTLIATVRKQDDVLGYLVCAAKRSHRIWQDYERSVIFFLALIMSEAMPSRNLKKLTV